MWVLEASSDREGHPQPHPTARPGGPPDKPAPACHPRGSLLYWEARPWAEGRLGADVGAPGLGG